MPRIDPQQLLTCLQVLLSPNGGILSGDEVQRLVNLMTKFSKKLVSKCIYILILRSTDKMLLAQFMAEGGWNLIYNWLQDANMNKNWALVTEVLELLLITPVDVERLKMNNLPKLVKGLTKREDLPGVQQRSSTLVEEWLKIVKDVTKAEAASQAVKKEASPTPEAATEVAEDEPMAVDSVDEDNKFSENVDGTNCTLRYKVILKDGKKVISKVDPSEPVTEVSVSSNVEISTSDATAVPDVDDKKERKDKDDKKKEKSNHDRNKHKSSSSKSSKSSSSSSSKSKDRSSSSSKGSSSSKDKRDKDRHRSSSSSSKHKSSSSSKSSTSGKDKDKKESKEKQAEKDKDTLAKIQPPALSKLGRIPKKSDENKAKEEAKKPTFSVEVRKGEDKPKTVKVFNSKMRSTGLLEEAKPPPPRNAAVKKPAPALPAVIPTKRPSPIRDAIPPPEKKSRLLEVPERPGAIKLIPPKPKPAVLQESDIFMDALTASATAKKEPKKRKRRASTSKEASPPSSPAITTPTSPTGNLKNITPANFYQDTLDTEGEGEKNKENENGSESKGGDTPTESGDEPVETTRTDANGLKGVLSYSKRKGPKRSVRWRPEEELVEIQYFELDETERVNVMKPFLDMAKLEMSSEREALRRKMQIKDSMEPQLSWRPLIELDLPHQAELVNKSVERQIQRAREQRVLQAIYFNNRIPDSPAEPDLETHAMVNPVEIPLEDPENPDPDTPIQAWPEPKGSPPHVPNIPQQPQQPQQQPPMFQNMPGPPFMNMGGPPGGFNPPGIPPFPPTGFIPPNMMNRPPGDWGGMPNGMPNGMPPPNMPPPPEMMNQGPPNMYDNFGPGMPENGFPPPFQQPNNNMPMFPPNNFNMRGRGGFRRGNNNGPWMRMTGPGPNQGWNNRGGGGGGPNRGGRFCINVKKHGYCRNRDNCPFVHPN